VPIKLHILLGGLILLAGLGACAGRADTPVSYNDHIRPIFNQKCLGCHGGVQQHGDFSLLFREEAFGLTKSGKTAITPGDHRASELFRRISSVDPDERMPPKGDPLTGEEIALIARWIDEGAQWETHWAYRPPGAVTPPPDKGWGSNDIDRFVARRLEAMNLAPAPPADRATLLRRVSLDLTGLPPTPEEARRFLDDEHPDAYERLIDRLLASPHFGEHWASMWLDLARYADSQGYQKDLLRRHIWRYRDWVIDAFNRDLPFDQFTIEQLAGDLLPAPTDDQLLATAFHRNTNTNDEGGTDDEEFRVAAVIDRLNTTFEIWQGVTMGCVQCHSHPYDPFRHEEFYTLMAFFNNTKDADRTDEFPRRSLLSPAQRRLRDSLQQQVQLWEAKEEEVLDSAFIDAVAALEAVRPGPVPVMQEFPPDSSRTTHIFERGNWLVHGREVRPGVPGVLPPLPEEAPPNRLGLAQWLVDPANPLTGRVIVNRFWAQLFGNGLVATVEDFGTQGDRPLYPGLLDWLAHRFVHDHQWRVKALLREIVLSATYRQSSQVTPEKLEADPYNRYLSRGPRFRLSAEQVRDQALAISGLLSRKLYGPSVMPYQPQGVWNVIRHAARWETSPGEDRYRRGVYTFSRKTIPYPSMETFDRPSREFCVSRRIRTNTPLQAMVTLNDPVYVEAAAELAYLMREEGGETPAARIAYGYRRLLFKDPAAYRLDRLLQFYEATRQDYAADTLSTRQLVRQAPADDSVEMAALVNVANVLLNLDEVLVKN